MQDTKLPKSLIIFLFLLFSAIVGGILDANKSGPLADHLYSLYHDQYYDLVIQQANMEELFQAQDYDSLEILAKSYYNVGQYDTSLSLIRRILSFSDTMNNRILLYNNLEYFNETEEQKALIAESLEIHRSGYDDMDLDDQVNFCYWLILNGNNEEAIEKYTDLTTKSMSSDRQETIYNNLAWAYNNIQDFEHAVEFSKMSLKYREDSITLTNLANAYYGLGNYEEALETFQSSYAMDKNNSYSLYGYALSLEALQRSDEAIQAWEDYTELRPYDLDGWQSLYFLIYETDDEKTREVLKEMVALEPTNGYYMSELLVRLDRSGQDELLKDYLALYKDHNDDDSYSLMYADYLIQVNPEAGLAAYEDYILSTQADIWSTYYFFDTVYWQGDEQLLNTFEAFLDKTYGYEERLAFEFDYFIDNYENDMILQVGQLLLAKDDSDLYVREEVGLAALELGKYDLTIDYLETSITSGTPAIYVLNAYIDALISLDRLDQAKTYIQKALNEEEANSTLYLHLARVHMKEGNEEEAKANLKLYVANYEYAQYMITSYEEFNDISFESLLEE